MMEILPGVLAYNEQDFKDCLLHPGLNQVAKTFHVDVLDGSLFENKCWADPKIVGSWSNLPNIELHCMVSRPLKLIEAWKQHVPTLTRAIIHHEIGRDLSKTIDILRSSTLEVVVAVSPNTTVDQAVTLSLDGLLIMGVNPGLSGQKFLGQSILSKIKRAQSLQPKLLIEVDGGVTKDNLGIITANGASRCVATSALWSQADPVEAYTELISRIN